MSDIAIEAGLMNRAMQRVASFWRDLASVVQRSPQAPNDFAEEFRECLQARGGEVSARNRAAALAMRYRGLDEAGKLDFLRALASFDSNAAAVTSAIEKLSAATDAALRAIALAGLRRALEPPRLKLLTAFAAIPDGVKFLVEMRAELLRFKDDEPPLQALETDLKGLLASWFDVGFLELRAIDWKSPAVLLEKLAQNISASVDDIEVVVRIAEKQVAEDALHARAGHIRALRSLLRRADKTAVERLAKYGVATVHEAMGRVGMMHTYMRPVYAGARVSGTALTVLLHPGDNWMLHVACELVQPGDIVVAAISAPWLLSARAPERFNTRTLSEGGPASRPVRASARRSTSFISRRL
jgi:hypothetical protein